MKRFKTIAFIAIILTLISCDHLKNTKDWLVDESIDLAFGHFDAQMCDTKWNKRRFKEFFNFAPTSDVKNIYCFGDIIAFDNSFSFSFNCNEITVQKIVSELELSRAHQPDNYSQGIQQNFRWWDKKKIEKLIPYYKKNSDHTYYWYLWYDVAESKAYYLEFDM